MTSSERITHENAMTQFVSANGVKYGYRKLGAAGGVPLVFCQRFRGTMDDWDPAVVNGLAKDRPVYLFNNAGVGSSSGIVPDNIGDMAAHAIAFIDALGLKQVDLLGFSMGGHLAQMVTLNRPDLVRRLVLAGTYSGGGEGIAASNPEARPVATRAILGLEEFLFLFFSPTETSQRAGREYWARLQTRQHPVEPAVPAEGVQAQLTALGGWGQGVNAATPRLKEIKQPVLVTNGREDIMVATVNSFTMVQRLADGQLIVYPDSGHGFLFQHADLFVEHVRLFLR